MRRAGSLVAAAITVAAVVSGALPLGVPRALAHGTDPNVVSVLDEVVPVPPPPVRVTVLMGVAAELVVTNPTSTPIEALDDAGRAFLRISAAGVEADVSSPAFVESSAPAGRAGAVPATAPPRFVLLSSAPTWSWFDHRLHPPGLQVPRAAAQARGPSRLAEWVVPLRYGTTALTLRGHVEYRRQLGRIMTALEPTDLPAAIQVGTIDGRLPGLFVRNSSTEVLQVLDGDGATYAEIGPSGVHVDPASPIHLADRRARGDVVTPAPRGTARVRVSIAPSYTWLDPRLRNAGPVPREAELRTSATTLLTWRVAYRLAGREGELRGTTSFVPFALESDRVDDGRRRKVAAALTGTAVLAFLTTAVVRRRVRSAGRDDGARRASYSKRPAP
ncbi:MAG TPA: hypothetical protein VNA12_03750 [Mycobacteriales bacterium]|nr:hypothetical protein [Mycobacteriales bacterium]